jgi:hypothetical protein
MAQSKDGSGCTPAAYRDTYARFRGFSFGSVRLAVFLEVEILA